jgi:hypothetical protein
MLLILTSEKDLAADFLIVELLKRQLPYFRLNAEDLGERADYVFSLDQDDIVKEIVLGPKTLDLRNVAAVLYRRAIHPVANGNLTPGERHFVAGEVRHLATGITLNSEVLWVNPIDRVTLAEHKLHQLQVARNEGLRVPRTLVSRDVSKLQSFAASNSNGTICKPIFHGLFLDGASSYSVYTRRVSPDAFDAESVSVCPVLLQEEIPRIADVRATFIGSHCFVTDIRGDEHLVDWRDPQWVVRYSISSLSKDVEAKCRAMLAKLGLIYGAFDFIRTPEGELVFLEVNPTGEWAWLEDRLGFPMRHAFVELLFGEQK